MENHIPGVFTIDNLYKTEQIGKWKTYIENSHNLRKFNNNQDFKNGKVVAPEMSTFIWNQIRDYLPPNYTDINGRTWKFIGVSKYIMFASILPGQSFPIHTDTGAEFNIQTGEESKFTLLIYLNDDFNGGRTVFYDSLSFEKTVEIVPVCGRTLLFDIDFFHSGEQVLTGEKKWIGTELVCCKE